MLLALKQWAPDPCGHVALHLDNGTAMACILREGGTRLVQLLEMTCQLYALADHWSITLRPAYLPGVANIEADALSHQKRVVEWVLLPGIAAKLYGGAP